MTQYVKSSELVVRPDFDALLHALDPAEVDSLKESMLKDGWDSAEPARIWGSTVVDGHNRLRIAQELGIVDIPVAAIYFDSDVEAKSWIYTHQIGRRNTPPHIRSLYIGKLFELIQEDKGTAKAVKEIAETEGRSERSIYRDLDVAKAYEIASDALKEDYVQGTITKKDLIDALTPKPTTPTLKTPEEMLEHARSVFPSTVYEVAKRLQTAIQNVRGLAGDIDIVFKNQGVSLTEFAPLIADLHKKLWDETQECERLMKMVYTGDGKFAIHEEDDIAEQLAELHKERATEFRG